MKKLLFAFFLLLVSLPAVGRQMYVVCVGIADYAYQNDLTKTEKDARDVGVLFRTHTPYVYVVTGAQATRANVLKVLGTVFGKAQSDDIVVFFFSGHGSEGGMAVYETGGPRRNPSLGYKDIQRVLRRCKAKTKLLFVDACHSGGARAAGTSGLSGDWNSMADKNKVMLFLSSRTGESSLENPGASNGMFTTHLLRALKGGADRDRDRIVTARELFDFVSTRVQRESGNRQHPVMWGKFADNLQVLNWNRQ